MANFSLKLLELLWDQIVLHFSQTCSCILMRLKFWMNLSVMGKGSLLGYRYIDDFLPSSIIDLKTVSKTLTREDLPLRRPQQQKLRLFTLICFPSVRRNTSFQQSFMTSVTSQVCILLTFHFYLGIFHHAHFETHKIYTLMLILWCVKILPQDVE